MISLLGDGAGEGVGDKTGAVETRLKEVNLG